MIYIRKRRTPISIKKASDNIKKDPASGYRAISLSGDTSKLRELFERMPKNEIRENLFKEQHGICAYCMRSINFDASGRIIRDTSTKIVATCRSMYDSVSTEFARWEKKKCLTSTFLQSKIDILEKELKNDNVAQPFIGVKLYRYKKKCDSLKRQHK